MYLPPHFKEDRLPVLHEAIRQARLATLVTLGTEGLTATPVPLLLDPGPAPYGTLYGHIARANPQWRDSAPEVEALAIFMGPHAYVSPAWYPTKQRTGKVVPTWNYVTVHAYGRITFFDDPDQLLRIVTRLTDRHESGRPDPWAVTDAPEEYIRSQLKGIVGLRLEITRMEGKWKLSQNQPAENRAGVIEGLSREGGETEAAVAMAMGQGGRTEGLTGRKANKQGTFASAPRSHVGRYHDRGSTAPICAF